jgi:Alpha/beta hydrolase
VNRPTVSQARDWRPDGLRGLADAWVAAAGRMRAEADCVDRDTGWTGNAADRARESLDGIVDSVTVAARLLVAAAVAARDGATRIDAARHRVLDGIAEATSDGYAVGDDGVVSATPSTAALLRMLCAVSSAAAQAILATRTAELTGRITALLDALGEADTETARDIDNALGARDALGAGDARPAPTRPAGMVPDAVGIVSGWPTMSQDRIAASIAAMPPTQQHRLIADIPYEVGNTDGVPWTMRVAANRINIADAILRERRTVDRSEDDKIRAVVAVRYGALIDPVTAERSRAALYADPAARAGAVAEHDRDANRRIAFYEGLLSEVPDATGSSGTGVERQILAFDPARSSLVELTGDLRRASNVGVLVPGLNTTVEGSGADTETVRRFVAAGHGDIAMITYLGGPFPTGDMAAGVLHAADPRYALDMAPRLVAFSEDVNRTVDATGRSVAVTYIGHSYGGSILGTAERLGLTGDRSLYVEAAGAGVGVHDPGDWHNRNPDVRRYVMTAPGDPIQLVQGWPLGPHGADPDTMPGMVRLATGRRLDGSPMRGLPHTATCSPSRPMPGIGSSG